MTYQELWCRIAKLLNRKAPLSRLGPALNWGVGMFSDVFNKIRGREGQISSASMKLGSLLHYYDSSKAAEELDYKISPLELALTRAINFLAEHGMIADKFKIS